MTKATRNYEGGKTVVCVDVGIIRLEHHRGGVCVEKRTYTAQDLVDGNIDQMLFNSALGSINITSVKGASEGVDPFDLSDLSQMGDYSGEWARGEMLKTP
jgi:hypothetical protein